MYRRFGPLGTDSLRATSNQRLGTKRQRASGAIAAVAGYAQCALEGVAAAEVKRDESTVNTVKLQLGYLSLIDITIIICYQ